MKWTRAIVFSTIFFAIAGSSFLARAADIDDGICRNLRSELEAMRQAQGVLLTNMVQSNGAMATTLDQYSNDLKKVVRERRPVLSKEVLSLHQSAETFRAHQAREAKLVSQFNQASEALIRRVQACLR